MEKSASSIRLQEDLMKAAKLTTPSCSVLQHYSYCPSHWALIHSRHHDLPEEIKICIQKHVDAVRLRILNKG